MTIRFLALAALLISSLALSACGFTPVYGSYAGGGSTKSAAGVAAGLDSVSIDIIPDRAGQKLRNTLMDRFYATGKKTAASSAYRLHVSPLIESIYGLGIAKDATATRSQIKHATSIELYDGQGQKLLRRDLTAVASFNTLSSQYTTLVSEQGDQVIADLAQQIVTQLELYLSNPSAFPAPEQ